LAPIPVELEEIPKGMFSARAEKAAKSLVVQEIPSVTGDSAGSVVEVLRTLVAQRTELPSASVSETAQLLRDLHLNSIVVGEIIASAARQLGVVPPANLLSFSDASIGQLAVVLEEIRDSGGTAPAAQSVPAGVDDWCRTFFVDWLPRPIPASPETKAADGKWRIFGRPDHPFLQPLSNAALTGNGVVVCISDGPIDEHLEVLFAGARAAIDMPPDKYFVVLGPVKIVGSFARTINIEHPNILTRVIEAFPGSDVVGYVKAELSRPQTHIEARYDSEGARYEPCFKLLTPAPTGSIPIQHGEVVLVSGGAKGIAAECALALAKETGAKLVLLGRSGSDDPAVSAQLRTLEANGIVASYFPADVTDLEATRSAVGKAEQLHGPVVGIIHGAGHNQPMLAGDRDETKLWATFAVKVQGFRNLLRSANVDGLRLLVSFGSVIGRTGLRGQSDYALANAALSSLTEEFARAHPHCRCLAFESSAWSGIGMAERLGKIEALRHAGVTPIPAAEGISWFRKLIAQELPATSIVVTGRLGAECPIPITGPALPLLRFLERACVHYPGVELIVESDLTTISDPYVLDHVFRGQPLLPGVMGIEAMAQVARALHGGNEIPAVENLHFDHPIVVNPGDRVTLRIAALMRQCGKIDLSIRSSLTSFQSDHFRCSCVFEDEFLRLDHACAVPEPSCLAVDPERELYGSLLFQGPRFQRLSGYRRLGASLSWADIAPAAQAAWFNPYLPGTLVLGDAAIRDAALHSIQSCVPDSVLLPVGVDHISLSKLDSRNPVLAHATERWQDGDTYCYDLELLTPEGTVLEYWQGLRLRKIEDSKTQDWPDPLASALLEWQVRRAAPTARISAVFERERTKGEDRRRRSERSIQRAVDAPWPVRWTNNGKPEIDAPLDVSAAHSNGLTLAVASSQTVACDIEPICARAAEMWRDLLGSDRWLLARLIASQSDEDIHSAATRVWAAGETLAKADIPQSTPLGLLPPSVDKRGGISLTGSGATISTSVIRFRGDPTPFAVAVLVRSETCARTSIDTESALRRPTS
jgi:enediyne polyketide synthase